VGAYLSSTASFVRIWGRRRPRKLWKSTLCSRWTEWAAFHRVARAAVSRWSPLRWTDPTCGWPRIWDRVGRIYAEPRIAPRCKSPRGPCSACLLDNTWWTGNPLKRTGAQLNDLDGSKEIDFFFLHRLWTYRSYVPFFSMFVSKMLCDAEGASSAINSAAVSRCSTSGRDTGDSTNGSRGSSGVMKCARTHCFGSSTSRTDSGLPGLFLSATGACCENESSSWSKVEQSGRKIYGKRELPGIVIVIQESSE